MVTDDNKKALPDDREGFFYSESDRRRFKKISFSVHHFFYQQT